MLTTGIAVKGMFTETPPERKLYPLSYFVSVSVDEWFGNFGLKNTLPL